MRSAAISLLALASFAAAEIYTTEPTASTICTAGTACFVRWNDDANAPLLGAIGPCRIDLMTGGAQQQTVLQSISASLDVSTNSFVSYLPDATVGPNGADYFVRFQSLSLMSTDNPAFPYQSFSAKFTLNGMTGTFNSTIQGQIDGTSGSSATSAAVATSAAASSANGSASATKAASTSSHASSSAKASSTSSANGISKGFAAPGAITTVVIGGLGAVLGAFAYAI